MDINTMMASTFVRVKIVTLVHFVLTINALLGAYLPMSYLFYNILFFISLFWAIHSKESVDAVLIATIIDGISIVMDIITIGVYFNYFQNVWAIIFAIANLVARIISVILLHRELIERGGSINVSTVYPSNTQRSYEDIDRPQQSVPTNATTPQQKPPPNVANVF